MRDSYHRCEISEKKNYCEECASIQKQMQHVETLIQEHERIGEEITRITDFGLRLDAVQKRERRRQELVELREAAMLRHLEHLHSSHHDSFRESSPRQS